MPTASDVGRGDRQAASRVLRGGSFDYVEWFARCAFRLHYYPGYWNFDVGFRVAAPV